MEAKTQEGSEGSSRPRLLLLLLGLVTVSLALGALALLGSGVPEQWRTTAGAALLLVALALAFQSFVTLRRHFAALERLRGAVLAMAHDPSARLPQPGGGPSEVDGLQAALAAWAGRQAVGEARPDQRLQAVLASVPDALLVMTDSGQVSLVNHAASSLLGAERVAVGTSVFAALSRTSLRQAIERAEAAGRPVDAMLGTLEDHQLTAKVALLDGHGGAVIMIPSEEVEFRAELDADLALHDTVPEAIPFDENTPLAELPVAVLDTETTGLDVAKDRVISIGAVRLAGARIYRSASFDRLVHPGQGIPPKSTAIHGITDAMVAEAPPFAEAFENLADYLAGTVLVGHHIGFDVAILKQECARAGLDWPDPPGLCTLQLATALDPDLPEASLEGLAATLGVEIQGRHTALGDSLVAGEVFLRLLPRLADRGVTTLGQALDFAQKAKQVIRAEQQAGWS